MKSLLLDIYKTNKLHSGLGQFSLNFHNALLENHGNWDLEFLIPSNFQYQNENIANYMKVDLFNRYFPNLGSKPSLWHSLQQFPSHQPPKGCKQILTVHDLNFLIEKEEHKAKKYLHRLQSNIDRADIITSISHYTRNVLSENIDLKGKKVHVIHNGVLLQEFPESSRPLSAKADKFFFSIGIFSEKKNFHSLLPLFQKLKGQHLFIAGDHQTEYGKRLKKEIDSMGLSEQVHILGKIKEEDKYWYYKNCEAFLFPSMAEGFGMPLIEAMSQGKAVFASDKCSLPEIGGDAAFYWENFDPNHMLQVLERGLEKKRQNPQEFAKRQMQQAAQFSWEKCIQDYLNLYEQCL